MAGKCRTRKTDLQSKHLPSFLQRVASASGKNKIIFFLFRNTLTVAEYINLEPPVPFTILLMGSENCSTRTPDFLRCYLLQ